MKPIHWLIAFLAALSAMAGYLFSKISLIGRVGISLFYRNYSFFKVWWQGGLVVFAVLMLLMCAHIMAKRYMRVRNAIMFHALAMVLAVLGIYITYQDFRHTLSHRFAGERFHLGGYCFWLGWIAICLFFLVSLLRKPSGES